MFTSSKETIDCDRGEKFYLSENKRLLTCDRVLNLWQHDKSFRSFFIDILTQAPFTAYRWETPPLTTNSSDKIFEFVLLNSPTLNRTPNPSAFADYLKSDRDLAMFPNLRGDALLIVPSLQGSISAYGHLAAFVRKAPESQKHSLWQEVGQVMQQKLTAKPIWLNTAGAGVPWLHIRLDSRPKYYGYKPYKEIND